MSTSQRHVRTTQNKIPGTSMQIYISADGTYLQRKSLYMKPPIWEILRNLLKDEDMKLSEFIAFLILSEAAKRKGVI